MRRPLILNGFMATGQSTVGALVARTTGRPFIDLDRAIESEAGASIENLFATRGEAAFRRARTPESSSVCWVKPRKPRRRR